MRIGVGFAIPILSSTGVASVPPDRAGIAGGVINTARQLGFAFGIAALGSIFTSRAALTLADWGVQNSRSVASTLASGGAGAIIGQTPAASRHQVVANLHAAFASGLDGAFVAAGIAALIGAALACWLVRPVKPHWQAAKPAMESAAEPARDPADALPAAALAP